jgi:RNA polymerase sigma-70 factor (family 1)
MSAPEPISDETCIERIRAGDESALQELLRRHRTRLIDFAHSLLRRHDLAEEAVSNVFLALWRRRETLAIKSNIRSYLFAAVGNQSLNLRKRDIQTLTVGLEHIPQRQLIDARSSDTDLLYRELQDEIGVLLANMPKQRQLVFRMNRFEGLRYLEIAEALGLSEHTVQNHMVQAVKQLALELPRLRTMIAGQSTATPF